MSCLFVFVTKQPLPIPGLWPRFHLYIFHTVNFLYKPKEKIKKKKSLFFKKKSMLDKELQATLSGICLERLSLCLLATHLPHGVLTGAGREIGG